MKKIIERLGYQVSETRLTAHDRKIELLYLSNTDGSIRWVWPRQLKTPLFLKFYNAQGVRSRVLSMLLRFVFFMHLQGIMFRHKVIFVSRQSDVAGEFNIDSEWALFTGTTGPNNKGVVYTRENGIGSFIKVAMKERAERLLECETNTLNRLGGMDIRSFAFPEIYFSYPGLLRQFDLVNKGYRNGKFSDPHFRMLAELNELTGFRMRLLDNDTWTDLKHDLRWLVLSNDPRLPKGMLRKLERLVDETNEFTELEVGLCHGDFTPWNMFLQNGLPHVYDWELASPMRPLGFDAFHFIIQQGILVEHKSWKQIRTDINFYLTYPLFEELSKFKNIPMEEYLKLYLIYNTVYYLKLYSQQTVWHDQVNWLINTWNEGLSTMLREVISPRELVLIDAFDFLIDKPYAAIKFQNGYPETVSKFSDVDLCVDRSVVNPFYNFLSNHPLVDRVKRINKSYMSTQQVFFNNGDVLSFDLVWQLKRKGLELWDKSLFLTNSKVNSFGVKLPDTIADARYVGLFYMFNNAAIPARYNYYEEILSRSTEAIDRQLYPCFVGTDFNKKYLVKFIKSQAANKGLVGLRNKLAYMADSVRTLFRQPGFIITFSGVDGAGKSTVIDKLKYRLEKQLRKRVVVLRHRPSFLPILSTWKKGRAKAEADTLLNLPRTGTNTSFLSSLFRFGYYYTDYLIGQFFVYLKYVSRGYVVIYDRYYFDFIHDSKRTNIMLPDFILKTGFRFLMKPQFNFFLYADPETILIRKKELNATTIQQLTDSYLRQFNQLGIEDSLKYKSIKNNDLTKTLDLIFNTVNAQAA